MKRLLIAGFFFSSGCFLFQADSCLEVGCEEGATCQEFFSFEGGSEFSCVQSCGDGELDTEIEECDSSDTPLSACNEFCKLTIAVGCGDGVEEAGAYCLGAEIFPPILGNVDTFRVVDFDADGDDDLVTQSDNLVEILFNSGAGLDTPPVFAFLSSNSFDDFVDVNGDGLLDVVTTQSLDDNTRRITTFLQGAALTFTASVTVNIPISHHFVDLNNDNNLDLVVDSEVTELSVLVGDGLGNFSLAQSLGAELEFFAGGGFTFSDAQDLFRDWDGDGDIDLIAQRGSGLVLLENQGGALGDAGVIVDLEVRDGVVVDHKFSTEDWDNDGDLDLMLGVSHGGFVLLRNSAGAFTVQATSTNRNDLSNGAVGDFNGDGLPDVLAVFSADGFSAVQLEYVLFENDGFGGLVGGGVESIDALFFVRARDFNGDGRDDVHFLDVTTDVAVLTGDKAFFTPQFLGTVFLETYSDTNGDGFLDLIQLFNNRLSVRPGGAD